MLERSSAEASRTSKMMSIERSGQTHTHIGIHGKQREDLCFCSWRHHYILIYKSRQPFVRAHPLFPVSHNIYKMTYILSATRTSPRSPFWYVWVIYGYTAKICSQLICASSLQKLRKSSNNRVGSF